MELRAEELRIGNIFFVQGIERYVKVSSIFKTHFRCEDFNGVMFEESIRINYKPIPLTEEILLKCGFSWRRQDCFFWKKELYIEALPLIHIIWRGHMIIDRNSIECVYLHQLQNIYFALTNQELSVKL